MFLYKPNLISAPLSKPLLVYFPERRVMQELESLFVFFSFLIFLPDQKNLELNHYAQAANTTINVLVLVVLK